MGTRALSVQAQLEAGVQAHPGSTELTGSATSVSSDSALLMCSTAPAGSKPKGLLVCICKPPLFTLLLGGSQSVRAAGATRAQVASSVLGQNGYGSYIHAVHAQIMAIIWKCLTRAKESFAMIALTRPLICMYTEPACLYTEPAYARRAGAYAMRSQYMDVMFLPHLMAPVSMDMGRTEPWFNFFQ